MSGDMVLGMRRAGDFIGRVTGKENAKWVFEAADEIERLQRDNRAFQEANSHYREHNSKLKIIGMIRVTDVRREKLRDLIDRDDGYGFDEVKREGFPHFSPPMFVEFFCKSHKRCIPGSTVTRIEFERLPEQTIGQ